MIECNNLCKHSQEQCAYCQKHYNVSTEEYKAKRCVNDDYIYGYLVKDKQGNVQGILNKSVDYHELGWVDESTIEQVCGI